MNLQSFTTFAPHSLEDSFKTVNLKISIEAGNTEICDPQNILSSKNQATATAPEKIFPIK